MWKRFFCGRLDNLPRKYQESKVEFSCNLQRGGSAMKKSKFSDSEIMAILKQAEAGAPVPELCREHGHEQAVRHFTNGAADMAEWILRCYLK
jgi:putative transposase